MIRGLLTRLTTPRRLQGDNDVLFLESSAEFGTIVKENDIAMICPPPLVQICLEESPNYKRYKNWRALCWPRKS